MEPGMDLPTGREAVLEANRHFYRAFADRDLDAMEDLWSRTHDVACIHPGAPALTDRAAVMRSWRDILGSPAPARIRCEGETVLFHGSTAIILCREVLGDGMLAATNVFVQEDGVWRMIHHQAGPMPSDRRRAKPTVLH